MLGSHIETDSNMDFVVEALCTGNTGDVVDDDMRAAAAALELLHDPVLLNAFVCAAQRTEAHPTVSHFARSVIIKYVGSGVMANFIPIVLQHRCAHDPKLSFNQCLSIEAIYGRPIGVTNPANIWWHLSSSTACLQTVATFQKYISVLDILKFMRDCPPYAGCDLDARFQRALLLLVLSIHTWTDADLNGGAYFIACKLLLTRFTSPQACEIMYATLTSSPHLLFRAHIDKYDAAILLDYLQNDVRNRLASKIALVNHTATTQFTSTGPFLLCNTIINLLDNYTQQQEDH